MKEFNLGSKMYSDDYRNIYIPFVNGNVTYQAGGYYLVPSLDTGNNDFAGVAYAAAVENCKEALTNCLLYSYIKNINVFVCPGDTGPHCRPARGLPTARIQKRRITPETPTAAASVLGHGRDCLRDAEVAAPAETFDLVEDTDWRGYNDGTWVVNWQLNGSNPGSFSWEDPPAMYHVDSDTWTYVDGHVGVQNGPTSASSPPGWRRPREGASRSLAGRRAARTTTSSETACAFPAGIKIKHRKCARISPGKRADRGRAGQIPGRRSL